LPQNIFGAKNLKIQFKLADIASFTSYRSGALLFRASEENVGTYTALVHIYNKKESILPPTIVPIVIHIMPPLKKKSCTLGNKESFCLPKIKQIDNVGLVTLYFPYSLE
jgi:hypothetical protein